MRPLPPPASFAEGQRYIYGLLASAAGMFCGAASGVMVALLMWGGWSAAEEHTIVTIFRTVERGLEQLDAASGPHHTGCHLQRVERDRADHARQPTGTTAVIVGLLAGGPVGRFKVAASRDGASIEADQ